MAVDKRKRSPTAKRLATVDLVEELRNRGYVCSHKSRVRVLSMQRLLDQVQIESFRDDLVAVTKTEMSRAFAKRLIEEEYIRFEIEEWPPQHATLVRSELCVIVLPRKKTRNANG